MQRLLVLLFLGLVLGACGEGSKPTSETKPAPSTPAPATTPAEAAGDEVAVINTPGGKIVLRLFEQDAPKTVSEFKRLAANNFYQATTFHRVMPGRLVQGGDPLSRDRDPYNDGTGNSGKVVPAEFNNRPFKRGTVGLARQEADPNSGSCQFFICLTRMREWDGNYTAFAEVVEGIEVAEEISRAQTNPKAHKLLRDRPIREQAIKSVVLERRKLD